MIKDEVLVIRELLDEQGRRQLSGLPPKSYQRINAALDKIEENAAYQGEWNVSPEVSSGLVSKMNTVFPNRDESTCHVTRAGMPILTFGLGYILPGQFDEHPEPEDKRIPYDIPSACQYIASYTAMCVVQSFGDGPRQEMLTWRELPTFVTYPAFEERAIKIAMWMRFAIEPAIDLGQLGYYLRQKNETDSIRWLPTKPL